MNHPKKSKLTMYYKAPTGEWLSGYEHYSPSMIEEFLENHGIIFRRVDSYDIDPNSTINDKLIEEFNFIALDQIKTDEKISLEEHVHSELEARVINEGFCTFFIHVGDGINRERIYQIAACPGDIVVIPGKVKHWFETEGQVTITRFFTNLNGWEAEYIKSDLPEKIRKLRNV